jgi:hypothetical protein
VSKQQRVTWTGRSLSNYKAMHEGTAKGKGVGAQLQAARTLTQARKILFGVKAKQSRLAK